MNVETTTRELTLGGLPVDQAIGNGLLLVLVVFAIVLAIATILMPLYVISMNDKLKRANKTLDKMLWHLEKQTEELRKKAAR